MDEYVQRLSRIDINKGRQHLRSALADEHEAHAYRSLAGRLSYLGQATVPQTCLVASKMQQQLGHLELSHVREADTMLLEIKKLNPSITYKYTFNVSDVLVSTLTDASHSNTNYSYEQSGVLCGLRIRLDNNTIFHILTWSSHKQRKISYSSFGSKILAAADGEDLGFKIKQTLLNLFPHHTVRHELLIDSKSLFETITILQKTEDYRLQHIVARLRDSFEARDLNSVRWILGHLNYTDTLTKRNLPHSANLNATLTLGTWTITGIDSCVIESEKSAWRLWRDELLRL